MTEKNNCGAYGCGCVACVAGTAPPTGLPTPPDAGAMQPLDVAPTEAPSASAELGANGPVTLPALGGSTAPEPVTGGCAAAPGGALLLLTLLLARRRNR